MAKTRSPQYPAIGLKEAIEKVTEVYNKDYQNALPRAVIASHMGYASLNGKSLGVLSALNKFGLIEGRGDDNRVSDMAVRIIAHPSGAPERMESLQDAASRPSLFAELDGRFQNGKASDQAIRSYLLTQKFIPAAADQAIRSYRETKQLVEDESRGYSSPNSALTRQNPTEMPTATRPTVQKTPYETVYRHEHGEPFRVTFFGDGIEVAGRLHDAASADDLIRAVSALKVLLRPVDSRAAPTETIPQPPAGDPSGRSHVPERVPDPQGVSLMITQAQRAELRKMGYDEDAISKLAPEMAHSILGLLTRN